MAWFTFATALLATSSALATGRLGEGDAPATESFNTSCVPTPPTWAVTTDWSTLVLSGRENKYAMFTCRFSNGNDVQLGKMASLFNCCYGGTATPAATVCSGFEALVNDRNYVWSGRPLVGYMPVLGGKIRGKPTAVCRASLGDASSSYVEPGFTDGTTCTVFLPDAAGTVRAVPRPFEVLYQPWCAGVAGDSAAIDGPADVFDSEP